MNDKVSIKVQPNGLGLHIGEDADFQDVVKEIENKFSENAKFYGKAKMTVSFDGKTLSDLEERKIIDVITKNSELEIICIIDKNTDNNDINIRALQQYSEPDLKQFSRFYSKELSEGQILESEGNIVIIGNIPSGCTVIASGNAIILGAVYGELYVGLSSTKHQYVIAFDFQPERMEINKIKYKPDKKNKISRKNKDKPHIAYVDGIRIALEPFTNELPKILQ